MNRAEFETELRQAGYAELVDRQMAPDAVNPEHFHEFDARLLVLDGELTIDCDGAQRTYHAGDSFAIDAGRRHAERSGPAGAHYLAGRRYKPGAAA